MAETISFARGAPSLDIVDVEGLKAAAQRALSEDAAGATAYGTAAGYTPLRRWLAERYGVAVEQVVVTNGSLQADTLLFDHLLEPGSGVVVEQPTYDRVLLALRKRRVDLHPVALQADGIDTTALRALLAAGTAVALVHLIPNHHNPAGCTLSPAKRREVVALAREQGFVIFEDDPYADLSFDGTTLETMRELDGERVIYVSSFSKLICPGVRIGFLIATAELVAALLPEIANTYISPNMLAQATAYYYCSSGALAKALPGVREALARRAAILCEELSRQLPELRFEEPKGGYFLWLELPQGVDSRRLAEEGAKRGVAAVAGADFMVKGGERYLRLAYSSVREEQIGEGVRRLAEAYRALG